MAIPNPVRELKRLDKTLGEGLPRCLLIQGVSSFFRQEAFDLAFAAIPRDVDLQSIDGDRETDGRELEALRGGTLFGRGAVLAIRRGEKWLKEHADALLAILPRVASGSSLLLEITKLDKRTKLAKALLNHGGAFEFRDLYTEPYDRSRSPFDAEMVSWLGDRSRAMGCPVKAEAAFLLMSTVGTRPGELLDELERIKVRVGATSRPLSAEQIRGELTCSFESTPFEFVDALLDYDRRRATRALTAMFSRGARGRDGARVEQGGVFPFITSWLYQSLAQLHEGRLLLDSGTPPRDVARLVGVRMFVERFEMQLERNTEVRLRRGLALVHAAQRGLRRSSEDPHYLLLAFLGRYFTEREECA